MGRSEGIRVFFVKLHKNNTNTASENRFWGIFHMVQSLFPAEVHETKEIIKPLNRLKLLRGISNRIRIIQTTFSIVKKRKRKEVNVLYLFGVDPFLSIYYYIYAKLFDFILISERNELPNSIINNKKFRLFFEKILIYPWYYKVFDGYSFISNELMRHYKPYLNKKQVYVKLPMTVDFRRFEKTGHEQKTKYILYTGSLSNKKDGIDYLIKAFTNVYKKLDQVFLYIAGNSSKHDLIRIKDLIKNSNCKNIKLLGEVHRDEIPKYIMNAAVCVLPRPDSPQARGGFPTKLGEYLASGNPVIVTDVGEISHYLTCDDVFFVSKHNLQKELEEKLLVVFKDYPESLKKGAMGQLKAKMHFGLEANISIIEDLIIKTTSL